MYRLNLPKKVYFKTGSYMVALRELTEVYHLKRAFVVTDEHLFVTGVAAPVLLQLSRQGMRTAEYFSINGAPTFASLRAAMPSVNAFVPDAIVGVGGGAAMSAAKAIWAMYEAPDLDLAAAVKDPSLIPAGSKSQLVLVASSFGSGAQNSPIAVLQSDDGELVQLVSQNLMPVISSTDADFAASMTAAQIHAAGAKAMTMALHALTAEDCCEYPGGLLDEAISLLLKYLKYAEDGCPRALAKVHSAGGIAGLAYGNVTMPATAAEALKPLDAAELIKCERVATLARKLGYADAAALVKDCEIVCS